MKKNMGSVDSMVRIILALVLVGLYYQEIITGTLGIICLVLAAVFVLTSMVKFCPLYAPFGVKTCKTK